MTVGVAASTGKQGTLAQRSGLRTPARVAAGQALLQRLADNSSGVQQLRIAWGDLHGQFRGKTLLLGDGAQRARSLQAALENGIGMVSTVLLKDSSDRTAFKVFEPGALAALPGFGPANNVLLLPDPTSLQLLPWAPGTAWLRAETRWPDGSPVAGDPRRALQQALAALAAHVGPEKSGERGLQLRCGLEVEFHIYRIKSGVDGDSAALAHLDPDAAAWPGEPPPLQLLHPGYGLLSEAYADQAQHALGIVRDTLQGLGLPLRSLEIELGPSQFEAVLAPTDALTAADHMLLLRNGLRQALLRAGYWATFCCRPPFAGAVASGWHLHQSLVNGDGVPLMARAAGGAGFDASDARHWFSDTGAYWLNGLLQHAPGMTALCAPTLPAYSRYQGSVMAPQAAVWAQDNRGALLRVVGDSMNPLEVRIENRGGEPMANPYLTLAAQVWAGLHGLQRRTLPEPACETPYAGTLHRLPASLEAALQALEADSTLRAGMGEPLLAIYGAAKRQEIERHAQAADAGTWERREYLGRY